MSNTALQQAIESVKDPEKRSKLQARVDAAKAAGALSCEMPDCQLVTGVFRVTLRKVKLVDGERQVCQGCLYKIVKGIVGAK